MVYNILILTQVPDVYPMAINVDWFGCKTFDNIVSDSNEIIEEHGLASNIYKITNGMSELVNKHQIPSYPDSSSEDEAGGESFEISSYSEEDKQEGSSDDFEEIAEPWEKTEAEVNEFIKNNTLIASSVPGTNSLAINVLALYITVVLVKMVI